MSGRMIPLIVSVVLMLGSLSVAPGLSVSAQEQIPFQGMKLVYYTETTQSLADKTGFSANGWTGLVFENVGSSSSTMRIAVNGTVAVSGQGESVEYRVTVEFPTDRDTLVYLRNAGQDNLIIDAGPSGQVVPNIIGFTVGTDYHLRDLTRTWTVQGEANIQTQLGSFSTYKYHTSFKSVRAPTGDTVALDFYAYFDESTQVLVYSEIWATQNKVSTLIEKTQLLQTNAFPIQNILSS